MRFRHHSLLVSRVVQGRDSSGSLKYANARTAMTKRKMTVLLERDGL